MKTEKIFYLSIILLTTVACNDNKIRKEDFFKPEVLAYHPTVSPATGDTIRSQSHPRIISNMALLNHITIGETGLNSTPPILPYDSLQLATTFDTFNVAVDSTFKTTQHYYKINLSTTDCIKILSLTYDSLNAFHLPMVQVYDSRIIDDYGLSVADHANLISKKHHAPLRWANIKTSVKIKTKTKKRKPRYKTKHTGYTVQADNSCIQYIVRIDSLIDQIKFVN